MYVNFFKLHCFVHSIDANILLQLYVYAQIHRLLDCVILLLHS